MPVFVFVKLTTAFLLYCVASLEGNGNVSASTIQEGRQGRRNRVDRNTFQLSKASCHSSAHTLSHHASRQLSTHILKVSPTPLLVIPN